MPRSPLTETINKVNGMVHYVQENLSADEYMLFLDLCVPEPEPEAKPVKKKAAVERRGQCAACDHIKTHPVHTQANRVGYHVYQPTRSRRAASLAEQIKPAGKAPRCTYEVDDNGGLMPCDALADNPIHDKSMGYLGYHEFVAGKFDA